MMLQSPSSDGRDLFGLPPIAASKTKWHCLPSTGFMRAARVPLQAAPPPKFGPRRVRVVDSFAGGGGASNGIRAALHELQAAGSLPTGHPLDVDFAVNHDDAALAMHAVNHPDTIHLPANVWQVSMRETLGDDLFGLLWLSPDCRDHSSAKGGPITSRAVRDLAWVLVKWLLELPDWQRPWMIALENVGAFSKWSPLIPCEGGYKRDPDRIGHTFHQFVHEVTRFGYSAGWKEVVACEHGSPTIRKRLKLVFRRDGQKVTFRAPTHGDPKSEAVKAGQLKPWPVAADIIDFSLPCPSILMTKDEARAYTKATGIRIIRPLATKTDARIAFGVKRHVLQAAEPFIVGLAHGDSGSRRWYGMDEPLTTVHAGGNNQAVVVPHVAAFRGDQIGRPVDKPAATVTANSFIKRPGGASPMGVVETAIAPFISRGQHGGGNRPATEPHHTVAASDGDQNQVIAAYIAQHNTGEEGHDARRPVSTIVQKGCTQGVVAASMLSLKGSDRRDGSCEDAHPAICAGGQHSAVVTLPVVTAYYGDGSFSASSDAPLPTVSTKDRFGLAQADASPQPLSEEQIVSARKVAAFLRRHGCWDDREFVTLDIRGVTYVIIDIGMRMLTPRELARAQDFPDSYILAAPYKGGTLSETEQRHKIGNSVCEKPAAMVIVENYRPPMSWGRTAFMEAAE